MIIRCVEKKVKLVIAVAELHKHGSGAVIRLHEVKVGIIARALRGRSTPTWSRAGSQSSRERDLASRAF